MPRRLSRDSRPDTTLRHAQDRLRLSKKIPRSAHPSAAAWLLIRPPTTRPPRSDVLHHARPTGGLHPPSPRIRPAAAAFLPLHPPSLLAGVTHRVWLGGQETGQSLVEPKLGVGAAGRYQAGPPSSAAGTGRFPLCFASSGKTGEKLMLQAYVSSVSNVL